MQEVACDKPANFDQDDNLIFQSYFTFCLLAQLMRDRTFVQSQYFKELQFDVPIAKEVIERRGVDNQGCLLICLYALLVIPKEKLERNYNDLFETINTQIASIVYDVKTNYSEYTSKANINYLRHIRNAVSHARVTFKETKYVMFFDKNSKNEQFQAKVLLNNIPLLLEALQKVHLKHWQERCTGKTSTSTRPRRA